MQTEDREISILGALDQTQIPMGFYGLFWLFPREYKGQLPTILILSSPHFVSTFQFPSPNPYANTLSSGRLPFAPPVTWRL